jgi:hypothetical protein
MPRTYLPTIVPHGVHADPERVRCVPLRGIAQVPDEADRLWKRGDEELPTHLQAECDRAIAAAMAEHRLRREAKLQGIVLLADDEELD